MVPQHGQTYFRELDPPPLAGTLQTKWPGSYKGKTVFPKALNKFSGFRVQGGFVPSVLIALFHGQAVGFRRALELLVVIGARTGSVLNAILKVLKMNHFMKKGSAGFFKVAVQIFSAKIDFIVAAFFGSILPSLPASTPAISATGMIRADRDHWLFQLGFKKPGVET